MQRSPELKLVLSSWPALLFVWFTGPDCCVEQLNVGLCCCLAHCSHGWECIVSQGRGVAYTHWANSKRAYSQRQRDTPLYTPEECSCTVHPGGGVERGGYMCWEEHDCSGVNRVRDGDEGSRNLAVIIQIQVSSFHRVIKLLVCLFSILNSGAVIIAIIKSKHIGHAFTPLSYSVCWPQLTEMKCLQAFRGRWK